MTTPPDELAATLADLDRAADPDDPMRTAEQQLSAIFIEVLRKADGCQDCVEKLRRLASKPRRHVGDPLHPPAT